MVVLILVHVLCILVCNSHVEYFTLLFRFYFSLSFIALSDFIIVTMSSSNFLGLKFVVYLPLHVRQNKNQYSEP